MTTEEFQNCTKQLLNQIWSAQGNYKYFEGFNKQFSAEAVDIAVTNDKLELWHDTRQAFFTAMIFELTRLYDKTADTLSIAKWINAGHAIYQSSIPRDEVEIDLATITINDPLVERLILRRNKGLFHVDLKLVREGKDYGEEWPLKIEDCRRLIERAFDLFNKYHNLFYSDIVVSSGGADKARRPVGDIHRVFVALKNEFERTKDKRVAFEQKRVKLENRPPEIR